MGGFFTPGITSVGDCASVSLQKHRNRSQSLDCCLYFAYFLLDYGQFLSVVRRMVIASDDLFQDIIYPLLGLAVDRGFLVLVCPTGGAGVLLLAPGIISV